MQYCIVELSWNTRIFRTGIIHILLKLLLIAGLELDEQPVLNHFLHLIFVSS